MRFITWPKTIHFEDKQRLAYDKQDDSSHAIERRKIQSIMRRRGRRRREEGEEVKITYCLTLNTKETFDHMSKHMVRREEGTYRNDPCPIIFLCQCKVWVDHDVRRGPILTKVQLKNGWLTFPATLMIRNIFSALSKRRWTSKNDRFTVKIECSCTLHYYLCSRRTWERCLRLI